MHDGVRACEGRQDFASKGSGPHIFLAPSKNVAGSPVNFEFTANQEYQRSNYTTGTVGFSLDE